MASDAVGLWMKRRKLKSMDRIQDLMKERGSTDEKLANDGW